MEEISLNDERQIFFGILTSNSFKTAPAPGAYNRDIYSLSKLKNREKFEGGLKTPEEFEETGNENREEFRQGGGTFFLAGQNIYPCFRFITINIRDLDQVCFFVT